MYVDTIRTYILILKDKKTVASMCTIQRFVAWTESQRADAKDLQRYYTSIFGVLF
jgi:hypothetical protein